jgi:hypothetical protein
VEPDDHESHYVTTKRVMLDYGDGNPNLLVSITQEHAIDHFDFRVINGAWDGVFNRGRITVMCAEPFSVIDYRVNVICDNQDRLRGAYDDVFANFWDVDWVAPDYAKMIAEEYDDDIPF